MSRRVGVVTFPGSNCDADFQKALGRVEGLAPVPLWHKDRDLQGVDAVVLPGGFSYGDYLRPGAIARFSPIMDEVVRFAEQGRPVLGVCNGFQILCEAGLLPGVLLRNCDLEFLCQDVWVVVDNPDTPFSRGLKGPLRIPISHGEGNYYVSEPMLRELEEGGQIVFRYANTQGRVVPEACPNGSVANVAGVCNRAGNVVGLMPHPERVCDPVLGGSDGLGFLSSLREVLA